MRRPPTIVLACAAAADRALLVGWLSRSSRRVEVFETGDEVLAYLRGKIPDLLIVDAALPGVGGIEICFRVKRLPQLKRVPVLLLSFPLDERGRDRVERSGADRVMGKPPAEAEFKRAVRQLLPGRKSSD